MECKKEMIKEQYLKIDGIKVKISRAEKGWTITKLSNESGVTRKTIGEIEKGNKKRIRYSTINQIAITLDKKVEDLCIQNEKKNEGEDFNGLQG
ncbi:hypothetical protein AS030_21850 [Fictibacillus enclensis]|uniref:HTH cro/C1-type domain-containing protein n=1 Tax=Fictibacillus enclensis TaxID=1017270 RepID=A0A0V8IUN6_9BACL|nr:hypothetical protein AS030_21850 [Fictibacillus enclensis]